MNEKDIWGQVVIVFCDIVDVEKNIVFETTDSESIEEWDSLAHVRLIVALEDEFDIDFLPEEIYGLSNLGALYKVILTKIS